MATATLLTLHLLNILSCVEVAGLCRLSNGHGVLLDAGEGTWGQMVAHYGHKQAQAYVSSVLNTCDLSGHSCSNRESHSRPPGLYHSRTGGLHTCCCRAASTFSRVTTCHCHQQPRHEPCLLHFAEQLPDAEGLCSSCQPLSCPA